MHYHSVNHNAGSARAMDVSTFEDLIDRLGDEPSQWPDDQRLAAEELLASSAEARALLEEARALRVALAAPPVRAPAGLADRIVAAARRLTGEPTASQPEQKIAEDAVERARPGKVLPALLLASLLLPALAASALLTAEPDSEAAVILPVT